MLTKGLVSKLLFLISTKTFRMYTFLGTILNIEFSCVIQNILGTVLCRALSVANLNFQLRHNFIYSVFAK